MEIKLLHIISIRVAATIFQGKKSPYIFWHCGGDVCSNDISRRSRAMMRAESRSHIYISPRILESIISRRRPGFDELDGCAAKKKKMNGIGEII